MTALNKSSAQPNDKRRNRLLLAVALILLTIALATYVYLENSPSPLVRAQEPKGPFPYVIEDVSFSNDGQNVNLAGTLTIPQSKKKHPAVILISGYGAQNRDAEWFGHKPFLIIADHLTRQGIAVLRFDDRGFGKSSGDYYASTSQDFSTDVESALNFLMTRDDIDPNHIGLIGHSDGAMIAPMVAARSRNVSFIVMLGGPGILGGELMIKRQELWARKAEKNEQEVQQAKRYMERLVDIVVNSQDEDSLQRELTKFAADTKDEIPKNEIPKGMSKDEFISQQIAMLTSPWFKYFFKYDPQADLKKVKCPVLAITGNKDVQAPSVDNLPSIQNALLAGGNKNVTVKELQGLNHMFQECTTGWIDEYSKIDQTFSPIALDEISQFVLKETSANDN